MKTGSVGAQSAVMPSGLVNNQAETAQKAISRATSTETFSLRAVIRRSQQRLQRPGHHWFLLLYLAGVSALFTVAGLLKFTVNLL